MRVDDDCAVRRRTTRRGIDDVVRGTGSSPPPRPAPDDVDGHRRRRREREASAIREHLELHESHHDASSSSSPHPPDQRRHERPSDSAGDDVRRIPSRDLARLPSSSSSTSAPSSWSVERHPLSLSRYLREFHQISPIATGSFGSVYRAMHKLEMKHYAVKRVKFATCGYYAKSLSLVMREVRILARLDHPNCVRYYTSWLEPSWMTGDNDGDGDNGGNNIDVDGGSGMSSPIEDFAANRHRAVFDYDVDEGRRRPRLLVDVERAIGGLHDADTIDESVERRLEAILYGWDDDLDDGFDWTDDASHRPSPRNTIDRPSHSSYDNAERMDATTDDDGDWYDRRHPSHRTGGNRRLARPRGRDTGGDGSDSDASEWTRDYADNGIESSSERDSYHNSRAYVERGSLELSTSAAQYDRPRRRYGGLHRSPPRVGNLQVSNFAVHPNAALQPEDSGGLHESSQWQLRRLRRRRTKTEGAARDRNIRSDRLWIVARTVSALFDDLPAPSCS